MRVLLHICCGPCAIYCVNALRKNGHETTGLFYNPNIYPLAEYDKRKEAVISASEKLDLPVSFYTGAMGHFSLWGEKRSNCQLCWRLRLKTTAEFAKKENYDAFCTTLLISPYQDHAGIKAIAGNLAIEHNINFHYEDFRSGFRESHNLSKAMGLYHQKYCGCIYSERERASC
jgi:epoxyqueuosine reductase